MSPSDRRTSGTDGDARAATKASARLADVARFAWVVRGGGHLQGERTLRTPGGSTTWYDARPYQEGDDPRSVDWRGYARTRRLHTRLHMAERGVDRTLFVDASRSMTVGGKGEWSDAIAQILVRARGGDGPCTVRSFGTVDADGSPRSLVDAWLHAWRSSPAYAGRHAVAVVGDLLSKESWGSAWRAVTARGAALTVVHVLAREEISPAFTSGTLRDVETSARVEVTADEVAAYRRVVEAFLVEKRREAWRAGATYARLVVPASPVEPTSLTHAFTALVRGRVLERP